MRGGVRRPSASLLLLTVTPQPQRLRRAFSLIAGLLPARRGAPLCALSSPRVVCLSRSRGHRSASLCAHRSKFHTYTRHTARRYISLSTRDHARRAATDAADRSRPGPRARTAWHSPRSRPIEYLRHLYSKQMKPGHPERNPNANPNSVHEAERLRLRAHRSCAELPRHAAPDHCAVIARELPVSLVTHAKAKGGTCRRDADHPASRGTRCELRVAGVDRLARGATCRAACSKSPCPDLIADSGKRPPWPPAPAQLPRSVLLGRSVAWSLRA